MKKKLIILALSTVLIFTGCGSITESESDTTSVTTTVSTTKTPETTTTTTTNPEDPKVTTTPPPNEDKPSSPVTTAPTVTKEDPKTEDAPVTPPSTDKKPTTTQPPKEEDAPIVLDKGSAQELETLLSKYPVVSAPSGAFKAKTLKTLIESAFRSFTDSKNRSITASGSFDAKIPMLAELSRQTLELSYLTNGTDYELSSIITEKKKNKITDDHQVYQNGWLYNTSTTAENGKVTARDNYKVAMTPEEFSKNVLANMELTKDNVEDLAKLIESASHIKVGMMKDGSCVILAKGFNGTAIMNKLDPQGNKSQYIDANSFKDMLAALIIGADGNIKEMYVNLQLSMRLDTLPVNATIEMTAKPSIPRTVSIKIPQMGAYYMERTIDEVYGDEDGFIFDWLKILSK